MRSSALAPLLVAVLLSGCIKARHAEPAESSHPVGYAGYRAYGAPDGTQAYPAYGYGYPAPAYHAPHGVAPPSVAPLELAPHATYAPHAPEPESVPPAAEEPPTPQPAPPAMAPLGPPPPPGKEPALHYAALSGPACLAEVGRRGLPIVEVPADASLSAVQTPVRITGPLSDVAVVMNGSQRPGAMGDYDILDCRLALAIADFSRLLTTRGVVAIHHASLLRKGAVVRSTGKPSQHAMGLAIDVARLSLKDGSQVIVKRDFPADIGAPVCVPRESPADRWLRGLVCETHQARLFNLILTPNFNADHHDHLHLDLAPGKAWFNLR